MGVLGSGDAGATNPYAPPRAPLADAEPDPDAELPPWSLEGRKLYVRNGAKLPDVCLFTGEPTTPAQRLELPVSWTPTWFRIMVVIAPLLALVAYSAIRKTAQFDFGLGPAGRKRRRLYLALTIGATLDGLLLLFVPVFRSGDDNQSLMLFLVVSLIALIAAAVAASIFRVAKIDRKYACIVLRPQAAAAFARLPEPAPPARNA